MTFAIDGRQYVAIVSGPSPSAKSIAGLALAVALIAPCLVSLAVAQGPRHVDDVPSPVFRTDSREQQIELAGNSDDDKAVVAAAYLVPSDRQSIPGFERVLQNALVHVQRWYADQVGGRSFSLADPVVRTTRTEHPSTWYASNPNGPDRNSWFYNNVIAEGFKVTGGSFFNQHIISVVYIDAEMEPGQFGGAGADGGASLHRMDIEGLRGHDKLPVCRWVGGLAHELGHALGRPHPPGCDGPGPNQSAPACETLMYRGMYAYPKTTLAAEDRSALDRSVFFNRISFAHAPFGCANIGKIPAQTPGSAAGCDLTTPGPAVPRHVCYLGRDGDKVMHGFFDKTGADRWHEASPVVSIDWTVVSETPERILFFDRSRNLYFELDLTSNRMRWKVGSTGAWVASHTITGHD